MVKIFAGAVFFVVVSSGGAQTVAPATDITASQVQEFLRQLPRDVVSDQPIRVVDVGGSKVGVYGVFRPKDSPQSAVLHETKVTEIYYSLDGGGTLVTGGSLTDPQTQAGPWTTNIRGTGISGGLGRRISKGDIVIIPGRVPHLWSSLDADTTYLIIRPDPEGEQPLK